MNQDIKQQIFDKILAYDTIVISRHIRPDGDAVGSTCGLAAILRATFPQKKVLLVNDDFSEYVAFLGDACDDISDEAYAGALQLVLDTATVDRISNKRVNLAKETIKIDHHVDIRPFGDISWVEDQRSSVCEMIADFYLTFRSQLQLTKEAALALYTGMMTDSGRYRYSVSGDTLRCGAALLETGIDTETLFARLYMEDFDVLKFKSYMYKKMKITPNGVAYFLVDAKTQKKFGLSSEEASNSVTMLSSIKGSLIWLAFIENPDKTIRVRLRSRFLHINRLAEKYNGGGHECASGATVKSPAEMRALVADADKLLGEYKATHEGWL